mgnify:CR=1 FL=1
MRNNEKKRRPVRRLVAFGLSIIIYAILLKMLIQLESAGEGTNIHNLPDAIWYSLVTLTTVGYGDYYPSTPGGRIIGYIFVLASLGILGLLISKINAFFAEMSENTKLGYRGTSFTNHVVIVGWNRFSQTVAEQMLAAGVRLAIITDSRDDIDFLAEAFDKREVYTLFSNFMSMEVLENANIVEAKVVFVNLPDDTASLVFLLNSISHFGSEINFGVVLDEKSLVPTFKRAGAGIVFCKNELSSKLIASYIFEPEVAKFTEDLIASAVDSDDFDIQQFMVLEKNPYCDKNYDSVFFDLKSKFDAILIGMVTWENGERVTLKNPDSPSLIIRKGEYLIIVVNGLSAGLIASEFGINEGTHPDLEPMNYEAV